MEIDIKVCQAVFVLFAEKGCGISMAEIASILEVTPQSLLSRYKSKDLLIYEIAIMEMDHFFQNLEKRIVTGTTEMNRENGEEIFKNLFRWITDYFKETPVDKFWKNMVLINCESNSESLVSYYRRKLVKMEKQVGLLFDKGIRSGMIRKENKDGTVLLMKVLLQGIMDYRLIWESSEKNTDKMIREVSNAYWNGIKVTPIAE